MSESSKSLRFRSFLKVLSVFFTVSFGLSSEVFARWTSIPGSRYTSARAAALGDAFLPLADDGATSLFYNPAGLGKIQKPHIEMWNTQFQSTMDYISLFDTNFYKIIDLKKYSDTTLTDHPDTNPGLGISTFPNFYMRGFALGVLGQVENSATLSGSNITYRSLYQVIPTAGFAIRLAKGIVRIGYSFQWVHQSSGEVTTTTSDPNLSFREGLQEGSAFSHNAGFALTLPINLLPAINIVARNIGTAKFTGKSILPMAQNSTGAPPDQPMTIDASFSLQPKLRSGGHISFVFQERDITNQSEFSLIRRFAGSIELNFRNNFFLRLGASGFYPSVGIGIAGKSGEFNVSYYSEEIGTATTPVQDTRVIAEFKIRTF